MAEAAGHPDLSEAVHDSSDSRRQQREPDGVQSGLAAARKQRHQSPGENQSDYAEGDVDQEDPPPAHMLHDQTTDQRTENRLDAAWDELVERGYGRFTIDGVAARAGTSRPVIYRRWPTQSELAIAAIRHHGRNQPVATPDTGSVRGDLIALLRDASTSRSDVAVLISVQMGEYFAETGRAPADLRAEFLSGRQ